MEQSLQVGGQCRGDAPAGRLLERHADHSLSITLKTLYLSNLTDMFGEIPCSEAFRGSGENLTKPRFDTQRAVYEQLLADLEYANSIYDTSVAMSSAQRDLLYGGDMMTVR